MGLLGSFSMTSFIGKNGHTMAETSHASANDRPFQQFRDLDGFRELMLWHLETATRPKISQRFLMIFDDF